MAGCREELVPISLSGFDKTLEYKKKNNKNYVFIILFPAGRFFTRPFPPFFLAARFLAAVILPPLLFFAMISPRF
jgi:hypothetical protein